MIVLDIETTGEIPWTDSILSIGAVDFSNPSNQFYTECKMREGAHVNPEAFEINGFTMEGITSNRKKPLKNALEEFIDWAGKIEDMTLAGHNHYMDVYFLEYSMKLYGIHSPFKYRLVDTHTLTYVNMLSRGLKVPLDNNGSGINSTVFLAYCGLPKEPMPHNALTGAKMEAEALSRLIYGKKLLPEYDKFSIPEYLEKK